MDLLRKSVKLLQEEATTGAALRARAAKFLRKAMHEPSLEADDLLAAWEGRSRPARARIAAPRAQLSTLALSVELDAFTKVKEAMDKMVAELKAEMEEEVKQKTR